MTTPHIYPHPLAPGFERKTVVLSRLFDDDGDLDPVEDYVEASWRVRSEEASW